MKSKVYSLILISFLFIFNSKITAQWVQNDGPYGGTVLSIVVAGSNIYAGGNDGLFISSNNGENWRSLGNGLPKWHSIYSLMFDGPKLYAGASYGMYVSTDYGENWSKLNIDYTVRSFAINDSVIVAASDYNGMFVSTNYGKRFISASNGLPEHVALYDVAIMGDTMITATFGKGIYISTNNGQNWIESNEGITTEKYSTCLAVNGNNLVTNTNGVIYRSINKGKSWTKISENMPNPYTAVRSMEFINNKLYVGIFGDGIFYTSDYGQNWQNYCNPQNNNYVSAIAACGTDLYLGLWHFGVFRSSDDGITWKETNYGLSKITPTAYYKINNNIYIGTDQNGIYCSTDNGSNWIPANKGLSTDSYINSIEVLDTNLYASTGYWSGVYRSTNNGRDWKAINNNLTEGTIYDLKAFGNKMFAGTDEGVYLIKNNNYNWTKVNNGLTVDTIRTFAAIGNILYAGTCNGVFATENEGNNWYKISDENFKMNVKSLAVVDNKLIAGADEGLFLYANNKWKSLNLDIKYDNYNIKLRIIGTNIIAGFDDGVYFSSDMGNIWSKIYDDIPYYGYLSMLAVSDSNIIIGCDGMWKLNITDNELVDLVPSEFTLYQNYPNPFNPSTTISFNLPSNANVSLKIYDVLGREVTTLVNEELQAGRYQRIWNAVSFATGVYFCNLQAGNFSATKKLILIK